MVDLEWEADVNFQKSSMKKIFFILIMALTTSAFSQNIRFEGTVKDTTGVGLEMANIMAINQQTKAMDAYAITNEAGKFILNGFSLNNIFIIFVL